MLIHRRLILIVALALPLCASGCVEESYTLRAGTDVSDDVSKPKPKEPKDDDPMPIFGSAVQFLSGDTIVLPGQRVIRLAGVEAPGPKDPFHKACLETLKALVRRQIFRMVHTAGSKYTDSVWRVNLLVPSVEDVELAEGIVSPKGSNANSVNCILLANGLVRPTADMAQLRFAPVDGEGKLQPLSDERNQKVIDLFNECYQLGKRNVAGIYSGEFQE